MTDIGKVSPGARVILSGSTFNTIADAVRRVTERQDGSGAAVLARRQTGVLLVKNNSGGDVGRFGILGIDGPLWDISYPPEALASFKDQMALSGVSPMPEHTGRFVVAMAPIAAGAVGPAMASGVCPARVTVSDEAHAFADVAQGYTTHLASGATGSAALLWKEDGTGEVWAVVRLGNPSAAAQAASIAAKVLSASGSGVYTVRPQQWDATTGGMVDVAGAADLEAQNLAELSLGPGAAVDVGAVVLLSTITDGATPPAVRYVFDHPCYAKYLD
jgi:hypothetical protein